MFTHILDFQLRLLFLTHTMCNFMRNKPADAPEIQIRWPFEMQTEKMNVI